MITEHTRIRAAQVGDHLGIANLMFFESHVHRHLDWRAPLDWLGEPEFWVLEQGRELLAALSMPPDPPGIAWLRLFAHDSRVESAAAWSALWETARDALRERCSLAAAICLHGWLEPMLRTHGFGCRQSIVLLEWHAQPPPPTEEVRVRAMTAADLPIVAEIDAAAFAPLWRNSLSALQRAFPQAVSATVAEGPDGLTGYQISTRNPYGAHLARLAVRPQAQRSGIGRALVSDLMRATAREGLARLTVNTQSDNASSLRLYTGLGFRRTGEEYPVYQYDL